VKSPRAVSLLSLVLSFVLLAACGSSRAGGQAVSCQPAGAAIVTAISTGLVGGTHLSNAKATRDPERQNVWLVAARIEGPSMSGQVGVWATNDLSASGLIYAVDGFADQFSDWGPLPDRSATESEIGRGCF
jgi:hypothetical protein